MALPEDGGGEPDNGGPWHDVQYRKNNRSRGDGVEWTFLVQNISDKVSRNVLWRAFQPFGFISDVYVARKRDSRGRCFGFVRYVGVVNMKETLASMNTVRMFDMKVIVSLAKYDKDHKRIAYSPDLLGRSEWRPKVGQQVNNKGTGDNGSVERPQTVHQSSDQGPNLIPRSQEGRSYADVLKDKTVGNYHGAKIITVEGKGSLYPLHCIGRSVIGYAKEIMTLTKMRQAIDDEGMLEVGLSFIGGVTFMLTFRDRVTANTCMEENDKFFNSVFSKYQLWLGEDIPFSRLVTLNITGVPLLIRDSSLFDDIGGLFGEVVQKSTFSWQEEDNSLASVKVITSHASRIDEAVVIKWNNRTIAIWVTEYVGQWLPDRDEVSVMDSQDNDYDTSSDSDMESENVDSDDVENLEEGELRQGREFDDCCHDGEMMNDRPEGFPMNDDHTAGNQKSPVDQGSPGVNAGGEFLDMHGEELGRHKSKIMMRQGH
ncbi:putative RNA recognition motif domain, nucleotide-binding alpha-beta plait domain superfamily [Helianthus debilis subsp. tardiflorus]